MDNFRTEHVSFEVVPFRSAYHAIFGRPVFAKFMARPCYIYNKLKIPGPNGIITINGDLKKAKKCEAANAVHTEETIAREELEDLKKTMGPNEMLGTEKPSAKVESSFKPIDDTKKVKLTPDSPSKMTTIGSDLDDKSEGELVKFLRENRDIFAWSPSDMPGVPRNLPSTP